MFVVHLSTKLNMRVNLLTLERLMLHGVSIIRLETICHRIVERHDRTTLWNFLRTVLQELHSSVSDVLCHQGRHTTRSSPSTQGPPRSADSQLPTTSDHFEVTAEIVTLQELNVVMVYLLKTNPDGDHFAQRVVAYIANTLPRASAPSLSGHSDLKLRPSHKTSSLSYNDLFQFIVL